MAKIFGASSGDPVIVKAGKAIVDINGKTLLALDVTVQYQRPVEVVPTLGDKEILSIGKPQGTFTANTILSKDVDPVVAFGLSNDGCDPLSMTIKFQGGACKGNPSGSIKISGGIASAVSVTAQGARGYIATGVSVTFTGLDM